MRIAILGFDLEGRANYDYFKARGHNITICDQNPAVVVPRDADAKLGPSYLDDLDQFDLLVRTPGLPPAKILEASPGVTQKITSGTNEFFAKCPTRNIIGVTGTKGKGTTSSLITKILEAAGKTVHLAGNIGMPALQLLPKVQADDWVVLELSSFQLSDLHYSPHIAVCLMVVPEHLNWHYNFEDYSNAKRYIFASQSKDDIAIYLGTDLNSTKLSEASTGKRIPFFKKPGARVVGERIVIGNTDICRTYELKLIGRHNWQNVCAAITAAWQVTKDVSAIKSAVTNFTGLEHRLEFVRQVDGVDYFDDSFGTAPQTAIVALESFDQPKVIILGGSDKGANYGELAVAVMQNNVREVITIGDTGHSIAEALKLVGFKNITDGANNMTEIVEQAQAAAKPGDVVLLSTASASFGLFKDYKDRGNQFKNAVKDL